MTEALSKTTYRILSPLPHVLLKYMKLSYRNLRFQQSLKQGRVNFRRYHSVYRNPVLFIAGLPKSGTSWLEKMLSAYKGYTIIPLPEITKWDYQYNGTHNFELSMHFFSRLTETLSLIKIHCHGSINNARILKETGIPYCIIYRDLRDAAVSYVYYVKRTPWHPEYPVYKNMTTRKGLIHFGSTLLPEWRDWIIGWHTNRDAENSIIVKYEDLLANPMKAFKKVLDIFDLPKDNIKNIIEQHRFDRMKRNGSFFRKGKSGDWKNHFDSEIKTIFKREIADLLIHNGYEENDAW